MLSERIAQVIHLTLHMLYNTRDVSLAQPWVLEVEKLVIWVGDPLQKEIHAAPTLPCHMLISASVELELFTQLFCFILAVVTWTTSLTLLEKFHKIKACSHTLLWLSLCFESDYVSGVKHPRSLQCTAQGRAFCLKKGSQTKCPIEQLQQTIALDKSETHILSYSFQ